VSIWSVGKPLGHIEIRDDLPDPQEFWDKYIQDKGGPFEGFGKPVLFRGAGKRQPAYELWTDDYLKEKHGEVHLDQVETEKKETRTKYPVEDMTVAKFLDKYNTSNMYSTAQTPKELGQEMFLLPPINCGGFTEKLSSTVTWMSSGGTKSVIHKDGQENIHCMIAGKKDWIMWHPNSPIDHSKMGWINAEQLKEEDFKDAYGSYVGRIDVDNVDLKKFPGWNKLKWWNMTLEAGDCAFIPGGWYHYVEAPPQRSVSVHVWFHGGKRFQEKSCERLKSKGYNMSALLFRIGDCKFGYGEDGNTKPTSCKTRKSVKKSEL